MKHVEFTRDMRPYVAGEKRVVPDDVATRLQADGVIKPNPPDWPEGQTQPEATEPKPGPRASKLRGTDLPRQSYPTKAR